MTTAPREPIVVLDDDPTGVQTLAGIRVLLAWDAGRVRAALDGRPSVHLITNTRALPPERVPPLVTAAARAALDGVPEAAIVLRGDSTLRGHLLEEYRGVRDVVAPGGWPVLLLVPALPSAGRITVGGVHLFERDGRADAAARDGVRARRGLRLRERATARLGRGALGGPVRRRRTGRELHLDALRAGGAATVAQELGALAAAGRPAVLAPDAETVADLELVAEGYRIAVAQGVPVIVRCAPTFAGVLSGTTAPGLVDAPAARDGVLVVCGSYVPQTTRQLGALLDARPGSLAEADVVALAGTDPAPEIERLAAEVSRLLVEGGVSILATPRERPEGTTSLDAGEQIARRAGARRGKRRAAPVRAPREGRHHVGRDAAGRRRRGRGRRRRPGRARCLAVVGALAGRRLTRLRRRAGERRRRRAARAARRASHGRICLVLTPFRDLLEERRSSGAAAGAFTCYDVTTAIGVVRAAEARGVPAILLVAEGSFRAEGGRLLLPALLAVAGAARVPMCVQLDHVADDGLIDAALAAGVGAVMADGSRLPLDENAAFVSRVRDRAGTVGLEVELGHIEGGEDVAAATEAGALTDPDEAVGFVAATRCDCLAVSIGNVHGTYARPPALDWERLRAIRQSVDVPLSLHGASGLPDDDLRQAIELGVCKVNVNTELRERYLAQLDAGLPGAREGLRLLDLEAGVVDAVAEVVDAKLALLAG